MNRNVKYLPISVIIPCYRCAQTFDRALSSILSQSARPQEVILVDDFSNDGKTVSYLRSLKNRYVELEIRIVEFKQNKGPATARNAAWEIATQPYIAFLDADDSWHQLKLEIQYAWMDAHPMVAMTSHQSDLFTGEIALIDRDSLVAKRVRASKLLFFNVIPTRSVMLKRDILYRFMNGKRYAEDYLLWLTMVLDGYAIYHINLPLAFSYKNEYGESGLSGQLLESSSGVVDTYKVLFTQGRISSMACKLLSAFERIKYLRRVLVVFVRRLIDTGKLA